MTMTNQSDEWIWMNDFHIHSLDYWKHGTKGVEAQIHSVDYLKYVTKEVEAHKADGKFWYRIDLKLIYSFIQIEMAYIIQE